MGVLGLAGEEGQASSDLRGCVSYWWVERGDGGSGKLLLAPFCCLVSSRVEGQAPWSPRGITS